MNADADLYAELGVSTEATAEEMKKVYRKLVLKCHPDKLSGKSEEEKKVAQAKFQRLVTAYEILSNPHQRAAYDAKAAERGGKPADVLLNVTLKESVLGATKLAPVSYMKGCAPCGGVGMTCIPCDACGGKPAWLVKGNAPRCAKCTGRGFGEPVICKACKGHGKKEEFEMIRLVVPPGSSTGTRIPIPGKDLHARVYVLPSKMFKRDGANVESALELTEAEAEEGGLFEVETLHGKDAVFLVGPLSDGDTKALEGKGVAANKETGDAAGDHVVRISIKVDATKRMAEESVADTSEKKPKVADATPTPTGTAAGGGVATDKDALAKLLAEKKAALLQRLKDQQGKK
eukprot:jgi/Tetstr1/441152/TSEL_029412.t1